LTENALQAYDAIRARPHVRGDTYEVLLTDLTGYLAPDGFLAELQTELGPAARETYGNLVLAIGDARPVAWAANVWCNPMHIPIASIGDAAKKLRAIQRNWALYSFTHHRRAALISDKLPKVSAKPLAFGMSAPVAPLGSWTLIAPDMVLASPSCSSPFLNGEARFIEDRTAPSRAYLKLWELFAGNGSDVLGGRRDFGPIPKIRLHPVRRSWVPSGSGQGSSYSNSPTAAGWSFRA
jgi:23S rRNA (cytidine2498-2'-O)-methyltransferase